MKLDTIRSHAIPLSRRGFLAGAGVMGAALLSACGAQGGQAGGAGSGSAATAGAAAGDAAGSPAAKSVNVGTMITEDFLPGWAAERDGLFGKDVTVKVTAFQSAQELSTALTSGDIDMAMTDPQVSAALTAGGTPVRLCWITLGATPAQGRFGIQVGKDSKIQSIEQLKGASIGVGSNTVPEYVMDMLLADAGIGDGDFKKEEVKKMPVRFQMMQSGQTDAAALPASLLALGEAQGCRTIADDTTGKNLSQSVMVARVEFADGDGGKAAVEAVKAGWDAAAKAIDADPESYRELLIEKTSLADPLKKSYPISEYPVDAKPTAEMIQPQLDWMLKKGYLKSKLTFDEQTGEFTA